MVQDRKKFERLVGWRSLSPEGLAALKSELATERQRASSPLPVAVRVAIEGTLLGATDICVRGNLPLERLCVFSGTRWATVAGVGEGEAPALVEEARSWYWANRCAEVPWYCDGTLVAVVLFESADDALARIGMALPAVVVGYWRLHQEHHYPGGGHFYRLWLVPHQTQERWLLETPR